MLFEIGPKERLEDFFNYREQYGQTLKALENGERLILIQGPRRTGKTTLMSVVYHSLNYPKIWIDGRIIKSQKANCSQPSIKWQRRKKKKFLERLKV